MISVGQYRGGGSDTIDIIRQNLCGVNGGNKEKLLLIQPKLESCVSGIYILLCQQYTFVAHRQSYFFGLDSSLIFKNTTFRKPDVLPSSRK